MRISDWSSDVCSSDLVEPVRTHQYHRFVDAIAQVLAIRAGRQQHVAVFGLQPLADTRDRFLEAEVQRVDLRAAIELRRDVAHQARQTRDADGPDNGQWVVAMLDVAHYVANCAWMYHEVKHDTHAHDAATVMPPRRFGLYRGESA